MFKLFPNAGARRRKPARTARMPVADLWQALVAPKKPAPKRRVAEPARKAGGAKPRAPLGETVRRIKAGGMPPATPVARAPGRLRGSFRTALFACEVGERAYKLYIPASASLGEGPMPLLIMLHGCSQTPEDFARGTRMNALAEEHRLLVAYPAQPREANLSRCWNWYRRGDQSRDAGEPALIAGLTRRILATQPADPARVYVAGLSAGASAALIVAAAYPDLFAAVGVHSGLPVGAAHDAATGILAMQHGAPGLRPTVAMPTIVFHGESDPVVNPRNGRYVAARAVVPFPPLRATVKKGGVPDGREFVRTVHRVGRGRPLAEHWLVLGSGHAWSGGSPAGSFTDPAGPDASREMLRFFLRHRAVRRLR